MCLHHLQWFLAGSGGGDRSFCYPVSSTARAMLLTPSCKSSLPQLEALIPAHRQQSAATTPESLEYCAIMQRLLDQLDRRAPGGPISSLETPKRADARLPDGASDEEVDVIAPENPDSPDHASSEDQDVADATKQSSSRKTEQNRRAQKRYRRRKKVGPGQVLLQPGYSSACRQ